MLRELANEANLKDTCSDTLAQGSLLRKLAQRNLQIELAQRRGFAHYMSCFRAPFLVVFLAAGLPSLVFLWGFFDRPPVRGFGLKETRKEP